MFSAVGVDSFVVVPIRSLSRDDHSLEGTRLTITKLRDQQDAHEFSIRTPVTPARWDDFDNELCAGFEAICNAALAAGKCLIAMNATSNQTVSIYFGLFVPCPLTAD